MAIHRYKGTYSRPTGDLYRLGLLKQFPVQKEVAFFRDFGINIIYRLKGCTPEKFRRVASLLLEAAYEEAERYPEFKWRFARFDVQLRRTAKGRKTLPLIQTYTAGKHTNSEIMVYGPPGGVPEEVTNFLVDKVNQIIDIPMRYVGRVSKQRPYQVLRLEICIRAGEVPLVIEKMKGAEEKEE